MVDRQTKIYEIANKIYNLIESMAEIGEDYSLLLREYNELIDEYRLNLDKIKWIDNFTFIKLVDESVRDWYLQMYPNDKNDEGEGMNINPNLTFRQLYEELDNYNIFDIAEKVINTTDVFVRDRCLQKVAKLYNL